MKKVTEMIPNHKSMNLSPFMALYDLIVPKDNMLPKINELIDFYELKDNYCHDNGWAAVHPIRMFKYLFLKSIHDLSDVDIVERSKYDLSFKYFLDMTPEEEVIDPSSLTKFRKLRLKDIGLLDLLINKTVEIVLEKEIIKSNSVIVDATHSRARYNQKSPKERLMEKSKLLRKAIYQVIKEQLPPKSKTDVLEDEIEYCQKLVEVVEKNDAISKYPKIKEKINVLKESLVDTDVCISDFIQRW